MQNKVYLIGQLIIVLLVFGLLSMLVYGLSHALSRWRVPEQRRQKLIGFTIAGLLIWLVILGALAGIGFFRRFDLLPPTILWALIPPLLLIGVLLFSPTVRVLLRAVPMSWLCYVQSFRILMELFLWMGYRGGYVPPQMTFEWLNYDIIVGVTAPLAGFVFFGKDRYQRLEAIIWNVFGIALLLNVAAIGILSMPTSFQLFKTVPDNSFIANFPFIWIPGFIVPFALTMHLFSLIQLWQNKKKKRRFTLSRKS